MIKKLVKIANELDAAGHTELANKLDNVITELSKQAFTQVSPADLANAKKYPRSPEWVEAVDTALPLLERSRQWIIEAVNKSFPQNVKPEDDLKKAISQLVAVRNYNANKKPA